MASKCANTIVVIHAAGIRLVDQWIEHPNVTATIIAHLPGQDSGTALVKLLYGEANFSGKLPYTLAKNESDYSVYKPCGRGPSNTTSPQCDYTEGVYLDYRAFDAKNITPRYEFGYGLSYTTFSYGGFELSIDGGLCKSVGNATNMWDNVAKVKATISNTGAVEGEEVAQLYIGIPGAPLKQLRGFEKVRLASGQSAAVEFGLTRRDLSEWDVGKQRWAVQDGEYKVFVGASSRDVRWTGLIVVQK